MVATPQRHIRSSASRGTLALVFAAAAGCSGNSTPGPRRPEISLCVDTPGEPPCPRADDEQKHSHVSTCDDPRQQLPCYCTSHEFGSKVATSDRIIAPCYPSSVQTPTSLLLGLFSAWSWTASIWPINADREPDYAANLGDRRDHATVWETWKTSTDVFLPDGSTPPGPGSEKRRLPRSCRAIDVKAAKAKVPGWEKVPSELPPRYLPVYQINNGPQYVVDREGQPLRVEIAMNPVAFDYIYENRLYNEDGQRAFVDRGGKVQFPMGEFGSSGDGIDRPRGAHFAKAAWKILGPKDDLDQFHKAWAYVDPWFGNGTMVDECRLVVVGLVGFHLTSKLDQAKRWSWATFEHASVAPTRSQEANARDGEYLYFTPNCPPPGCAAINQPPVLFPPGGKPPQPSNLVREQAYGEGEQHNTPNGKGSAVWVNERLVESLPRSVFGHYRLKGTQWFDQSLETPEGQASPPHLSNTLLEAYFQKTSTCLGCHEHAGLTGLTPDGQQAPGPPSSDLVFVLREARWELHVE